MNPITHNLPWIESPFFKRELAEADLADPDKEFVRFYAEQGYVIFDPEFAEEDIEAIKNTLLPSYEKYAKKSSVTFSPNRIQDAWQFNEHVKNIAIRSSILEKLQLLYRRRPIPFQTLNFDRGTQQGTHSDMIHFSSIPERFMCGVWVALENVTEENGPLHYYPGSHKLPFYEMSDMGVKASDSLKMKNGYMDYTDHYEVFIQEVVKSLGLKKKQLLIKKGQALIWAANLLHGGDTILTAGLSRHSQVTHYYFEDCTYYTPLFTDMLLKKIFLRDIVDITSGKHVPNRYLGDTVKDNSREGLKKKIAASIPPGIRNFYRSILRR